MLSYIVVAFSIASSAAYAQQQSGIYVPGSPPQIPGVTPSLVSVGADGLSTWNVNGATLAENSATAVVTQYGAAGPAVFNCVLGADAQATCSVQPLYDAPSYAYTEPITFFGDSTAQLPAAYETANTNAAVAVAVTSSAVPGMATSVSSATASPTTASSATKAIGPVPNAAQSTASNIFGANGSASATGAGSRSTGVMTAVAALSAVMAGAALIL